MHDTQDKPFLPTEFPTVEQFQEACEALGPISYFEWKRPGTFHWNGARSSLNVIALHGLQDRLIVFELISKELQGPVLNATGYTGHLGGGIREELFGPITVFLNGSVKDIRQTLWAVVTSYENEWRETSQLVGSCSGMQQLAVTLRRDGLTKDRYEQLLRDPNSWAELLLPRFFSHDTMDSVHLSAELWQDGKYVVPADCVTGIPPEPGKESMLLTQADVLNLAVYAGGRDVAAVLLGATQAIAAIPALATIVALPGGLTDDQRGALVYCALCNWEESGYDGAPEVTHEEH